MALDLDFIVDAVALELEEDITLSEQLDFDLEFGDEEVLDFEFGEVDSPSITVDATVTETSANPVKSSGIWDWVKSLRSFFLNYIDFNTEYEGETPKGRVQWNETDLCLDIGLGNGVTVQVPQEQIIKVRNATGATLENGRPVYFNGSIGNRPTVDYARSDIEATSIVAGILTQDIANNVEGFITTVGYVRGIKTNYTGVGVWGTTWEEGDLLYVSKTDAGVLTNIEPTVPHCSDKVGQVGVVGAAGTGSILIYLNRHQRMQELCDVNSTPLENSGQIPVWNNENEYFDFDKNINDYVRTDQLTTIPYPAFSFEKIQGGTVTGDITGVQAANDGQVLRVNEAAGGLTVDFTFTDVINLNSISLHLRYVGGANHVWDIQLWNYITSAWDTFGETTGTQDALTWFNIFVPEDENYISDGTAKLRFYHLPSFIATHYVLFDYVAVVSSLTVIGGATKENVTGLKITDSPEFADTLLTPLAAEATYTPSVWAYLVGLFTTVPKSIKEHLVKIWGEMQSLQDIDTLAIGYYESIAISAITKGVIAQNQDFIYLYPYQPKRGKIIDLLSIDVTTDAAAAVRILIYSSTAGLPDIKLIESANIDCSSLGIKEYTGFNFTFEKGKTYWIGVHSGGALTLRGVPLAAQRPISVAPAAGNLYITGIRATSLQDFNLPSPSSFPAATMVGSIAVEVKWRITSLL